MKAEALVKTLLKETSDAINEADGYLRRTLSDTQDR
jgi:hypothetical protein